MPNEARFAVLIDADNVSDKYIKIILDEISNDGIATYKRIYGDWTKPALSSWKGVLLDNSIIPIQQYNYTTGKNSTDSAMIIDAMDILYSGQVDGFCIVSSDSDFTRLAARLRESGMTVVGMGERKTPKSFISACNRFKYLDILATVDPLEVAGAVQPASEKEPGKQPEPEKPTSKGAEKKEKRQTRRRTTKAEEKAAAKQPEPEKAEPAKPQNDLDIIREAIRVIVCENSDDDDWMNIGTIGSLLVKRYPDFDVRNFGFSKLTLFLKSLGMYEFKNERTDGGSKNIFVKLK